MPGPIASSAKLHPDAATALYRDAIVIDATAPMLHRDDEWSKWLNGGVTAAFATFGQSPSLASTASSLAGWYAKFRRHTNRLIHATSPEDIIRAKHDGKLAIVFHLQNAPGVEYDLGYLEIYQRLGVRAIQLAFNVRNALGDGSSETSNAGLSERGKTAIREMNRLGILVDLSHSGVRTSLEAMALSSVPVVFSHSNVRAVRDHPRSLTDEQIRAVSACKGVIGLNGFPAFIKPDSFSPTVGDLLDHLDHIVQVAGDRPMLVWASTTTTSIAPDTTPASQAASGIASNIRRRPGNTRVASTIRRNCRRSPPPLPSADTASRTS